MKSKRPYKPITKKEFNPTSEELAEQIKAFKKAGGKIKKIRSKEIVFTTNLFRTVFLPTSNI